MLFNIMDLVSNKIYATVEGKGAADRECFRLMKEYPKRKLVLKMAGDIRKID